MAPQSERRDPEGLIVYVAVGNRVEIEFVHGEGDRERLAVDIVPDEFADFEQGFLGASTLLARALLGQPLGAELPYALDDIVGVHILAISPSERSVDPDVVAARQAATDRAVHRSQEADAIRLALTVDVKWGDYDPEGIASSEE